jgi:fermentation-respiration switch protein FrsA (DUF1100 family)
MRKLLLITVALLVIVFFAVGIGGRLIEPHYTFHPEKYPGGNWSLLDWDLPHGSKIEDVFFTATDGTHLHGWYITAAGENGPVVLNMHGNSGNLTNHRHWIQAFAERGISVFIFDYRGYGKSDGEPIEEGLYSDATGAYEYLLKQKKIDPKRLFLFGHSLGGAIAIDLASRKQSAGLIVESSFTSASAIAAGIVPVYPFGWFIHSRFDSIGKMPNIHAPLLIIHGDKDALIPFQHGQELYAAAHEPKQFYPVPSGIHGNLEMIGGTTYYETIMSFITVHSAHSP